MQSAAIDTVTRPSSGATNFAGVLASVTDPPWNDSGLAEDVTSISYERALRTHARCPSANPGQETDPDRPKVSPAEPAAGGRRLKTSSITIRLSEPECAQVRRRAAEAGLTVSAYLRSCVLEVEGLRTQVKETLAQLRTAQAPVQDSALVEQVRPSTVLNRGWRWFRKRRFGG